LDINDVFPKVGALGGSSAGVEGDVLVGSVVARLKGHNVKRCDPRKGLGDGHRDSAIVGASGDHPKVHQNRIWDVDIKRVKVPLVQMDSHSTISQGEHVRGVVFDGAGGACGPHKGRQLGCTGGQHVGIGVHQLGLDFRGPIDQEGEGHCQEIREVRRNRAVGEGGNNEAGDRGATKGAGDIVPHSEIGGRGDGDQRSSNFSGREGAGGVGDSSGTIIPLPPNIALAVERVGHGVERTGPMVRAIAERRATEGNGAV